MRFLMLRNRVLPVILVLLASIPATAVPMLLLYSKGIPTTLTAFGTLLHIPVVALFAAALAWVLVRFKKLPRDTAGFQWTAHSWPMLALGTMASIAGVLGSYLGFLLLTGRPIALAKPGASLAMLVWGWPAFVGNAALQQLSLQSMILAASDSGRKSIGPWLFGTFLFVAAHYTETSSAIFLGNVALFGLVTTLAFFRREPRDYAFSVGYHAGWNFAQIVLIGSPFHGEPSPSLFAWQRGADFWTGGNAGYDAGALFTIALVPALLFLLRPAKTIPFRGGNTI